MNKVWFDEAWDDYLYWQTQDKKTLRKINNILRDIERGDDTAKPEPLKGDLSGFWSRHIDRKKIALFTASVMVSWKFCHAEATMMTDSIV